jgi:hypothetical protein
MNAEVSHDLNTLKVGLYSSVFLALITFITFGLGIMAIPPAGPYCQGNCIEYPYLNSLSQYPKDYIWMVVAIFQLITFIIFMASIYKIAPPEKKIFGFISFALAMIVAVVLLTNYYIQFTVIPISLMKGETEGIALLTQYNGNGIFIALEELGFLMMSLSLLFASQVFSNHRRIERSIRLISIFPFIISVLALVFYTIKFGIDRSYRFEVALITVNWVGLIILGILTARFFKTKLLMSIGDRIP